MLQLHRYVTEVKPHQLSDLLCRPESLEVVPLGLTVDLSATMATIVGQGTATNQERATLDRLLVEPLHQALRGLPRRDALDMRFWHWLCIKALPALVWARWLGRIPSAEEVPTILAEQRSLGKRFIGSASLGGVNRNTFSRLYWAVENLRDGQADYTLARQILGDQDLLQAVFDREFSLYRPAARAVVRICLNRREEEQRGAIKRLNHLLTTVLVEAMDEDAIAGLLLGAPELVAAR